MSPATTPHPNHYWNHNAAFHDELVADAAGRGGRGTFDTVACVAAARILPGARIRRRCYWRYSLVWDRAMESGQ
ncbi:hypothetical protein [Actinomyces sp. MRS3W]|uniref:hypothetical protein n=1 Tax=Actinomyces sp. MRS3W TaxID=2800796 RepID=UPI0028FD579B|nr:hypothetical protein [Actinomyces sp. MRS3W]MDU0348520.1 hypothetical protein [Actinomyces sp. MRS3W]